MTRLMLLAILAAVFAVGASIRTVAMDEQRGAVPGGAVLPDVPKAQADDPTAPAKSEGTEIRIPGLGKLGTLPKMDFGLELLYGADDNKPANEPSALEENERDTTIHGSIKHRF